MTQKFLFLIALLVFSFSAGCNKCKDVECTTPPETFKFRLLNQKGENLLFGDAPQLTLRDIQLYGKKPPLGLQFVNIKTDSTTKTIYSPELGWLSAKGTKNFELLVKDKRYYFFIDVEEKSKDCCSSFETKSTIFEGVDIEKNKDYVYELTLVDL